MTITKSPKVWTENECTFLQECVIIGIPIKVIAKQLPERTTTSISQKINNEGLHEIKQIHKERMLSIFKNRYLQPEVPKDSHSNKVIWNDKVMRFVRKSYLMNIPMQDIASVLGVHWRTINNKVKPFSKDRAKFRARFARMARYIFIENPKERW